MLFIIILTDILSQEESDLIHPDRYEALEVQSHVVVHL